MTIFQDSRLSWISIDVFAIILHIKHLLFLEIRKRLCVTRRRMFAHWQWKTCRPRSHFVTCVYTGRFAYLKLIRGGVLSQPERRTKVPTPRRLWRAKRFRSYRDPDEADSPTTSSCCREERLSRNGDNGTMDYEEARFRLYCGQRWKQFSRIWVPLLFLIRNALPERRSQEIEPAVCGTCEKLCVASLLRKVINNFLASSEIISLSCDKKLSKVYIFLIIIETDVTTITNS